MIHLHHRPATSRGNSQKWLRRVHAWAGMSVAAMLLLFAVTGFLLNHRAVMKIPALGREEVTQVLPVDATPAEPAALAELIAATLHLAPGVLNPRVEPARDLVWEGGAVKQPERWILRADTPSETIQADYWVGSRQVEVKRTQPNLWLYLARLHMAIGTGPSWILFSDAAALALAFLALSGFWLWGRLHGSPARLATLAGGGLGLILALAWLAG